MEYLIFVTYEQAQIRNAELCFENGCAEGYYFQTILHPTNGEAALLVPEYYVFKLTEAEQLEVKDSDYMILHGWNIDSVDI